VNNVNNYNNTDLRCGRPWKFRKGISGKNRVETKIFRRC